MDTSELTLADIRKMHPQERRGLFEDLVAGQGPMLFRRAFSILHDEHLAEDVCQEAWGVLHRHVLPSLGTPLLNGSPPVGPIALWLQGVVRNLALGELRRIRSERNRAVRVLSVLSERSEDPERIEAELAERAKEALKALTETQRRVFLLRSQDDLPFQEIATLLDITDGCVRKVFYVARNRLLELLGRDAE